MVHGGTSRPTFHVPEVLADHSPAPTYTLTETEILVSGLDDAPDATFTERNWATVSSCYKPYRRGWREERGKGSDVLFWGAPFEPCAPQCCDDGEQRSSHGRVSSPGRVKPPNAEEGGRRGDQTTPAVGNHQKHRARHKAREYRESARSIFRVFPPFIKLPQPSLYLCPRPLPVVQSIVLPLPQSQTPHHRNRAVLPSPSLSLSLSLSHSRPRPLHPRAPAGYIQNSSAEDQRGRRVRILPKDGRG